MEDKKDDRTPTALPYPELDAAVPPTFQKVHDFQFSAPTLPQPAAGESLPVALGAVPQKIWEQVFLNCNLNRGLDSISLETSQDLLILPRNVSLYPQYLAASQESSSYYSKATKDSSYLNVASKTDKYVFAKATSPWVSASTEFRHSQENQTLKKGQTCVTITKELSTIAVFSMPPYAAKVGDRDSGTNKFGVNLCFIDTMTEVLKERRITAKTLQEEVYRYFGDVFVSKALLGSARFTWEKHTSESDQTLDEAAKSFQAKVQGSYGGFGGEAGGGISDRTRTEQGKSRARSELSWQVLGGGISLSSSTFRNLPEHWRVIHYIECLSVMELLPSKMQDELRRKFEADVAPALPDLPALPLNGKFRIKHHSGYYAYRPHGYWCLGEESRLMVLCWSDGTPALGPYFTWTIQQKPKSLATHYIRSHDQFLIYQPDPHWKMGSGQWGALPQLPYTLNKWRLPADKSKLHAVMWKQVRPQPETKHEWTFQHVSGDRYYIKSHLGYYLCLGNQSLEGGRFPVFMSKSESGFPDVYYQWHLEALPP
jgi:hypothetical protein